jgi:hypothetical protein
MESKDQKKKPYSPPALKLIPEQVKKLMADRKNAAKKKPPTS